MIFRRIWILRGPNIWARFPVVEAELELGELDSFRPATVPACRERFSSLLSTAENGTSIVSGTLATCSHIENGFLREEANVAEALLASTLAFQTRAGCEVQFGKVYKTQEPAFYRVIFEYEEEALARAALEAAREFCLAAVAGKPFDLPARFQQLRDLAHEVRLGPSTAAIVRAARECFIPCRRLNAGSLVQLGWGARQKRIWTAETDQTSVLAEAIAQDKQLTRALLQTVGVPIPEGRPVADAEDAWRAAEEIGPPVVVKPQYGNQGRGVATNLTTREQVVGAYEAARLISAYIVVEKFVPGADHRLLIIGGRLAAAALREPAHVVGDGSATVTQLIALVNRDPRRSDGHATPLSWIKLDPVSLAVLAEQGLTPDSIPPAGTKVLIRRNANLSTGGTAADVTDRVHPRVAARAVDAARAVGLDIAGVDVVARDVSRPLEEQDGAVVEVNAGPGLRMHIEPSTGSSRPVGMAIVAALFPGSCSDRGTKSGQFDVVGQAFQPDSSRPVCPARQAGKPDLPESPLGKCIAPSGTCHENSGRIPIVAVSGVNGKTTTTRLLAHLFRQGGRFVGMTCTDGIYLDGRRTETRDCSGPQSARSVLLHPRVEAAVLETARGGILREGLGFDRCDVAVVTNIGTGDHLGLRGIDTLEELARVKRVVVESVAPAGTAVLNAADPAVAGMAEHCPGAVLFFARDKDHPVLAGHRAKGGKSAFVRDGNLVLAEGNNEVLQQPLADIPLTHGGTVAFQVENALAAAAAAWSCAVPLDTIRAGLQSFAGDDQQVPGRFNVFRSNGATVIVDYAHNPSAVAALVAALDQFPSRDRTLVFSGCNRRDADLRDMGAIAGAAFDRVILYKDWGNNNRSDGELNALLREGLKTGQRVAQILEAPTEKEAIEIAWQSLDPGALIVLGVEAIEESLALVLGQIGRGEPEA